MSEISPSYGRDESQAQTLLAALHRMKNGNHFFGSQERFVIHVLGADETELPSLDNGKLCTKWRGLFETASMISPSFYFFFIGPNMPQSRDGEILSFPWTGESGIDVKLQVTLHVECCLYHEYLVHNTCAPDIAVAYNAGLWGYEAWIPSIEASFRNMCSYKPSYLLVTSYTLQESEDDYDILQATFDNLVRGGLKGELCWIWDCEKNPNMCPVVIERKSLKQAGIDEDRTYHENHFWQCVTFI